MDLASTSISWRDSLGRASFLLSVLVVGTSTLDLFVNRLLFRAGPEVLGEVKVPGLAVVAAVGRISFSFEQFVLYAILGGAMVLLLNGSRGLERGLGFMLAPLMASAALLYLPLSMGLSWDFSMLLVLLTGVEVVGLVVLRVRTGPSLSGGERAWTRVFEVALVASFMLPLYARLSVLLVGLDLPSLPGQIDAYIAGVYMLIVTSVAALGFATTTRSPGYTMGVRRFVKAILLPSLLVIPMLVGLLDSYFMTQIMSMVIAMSTDILVNYNLVAALTAGWWFLMAAVFVLWFKGRGSHNWFLIQQGIGLVFLLSTTFLFGYPNYLLLGTAGVLLICFPLTNRQAGSD